MNLKAGDVITFLAEGDRRFFCVSSLEGDIVHLVCPCCGVEGRALLHEVRLAAPAELQALLRPKSAGSHNGQEGFSTRREGGVQRDAPSARERGAGDYRRGRVKSSHGRGSKKNKKPGGARAKSACPPASTPTPFREGQEASGCARNREE